ncbi:MAG TPA: phage major capsid protein [Vicinamibacterales bacterium]|nr:phage major capsid protein [Vicinamibacterales bacterium]
MSETSAAVLELKETIEAFKKANDQALAQKAEKGAVDSLLAEKVEKLNKAIDEKQDKVTARMNALERRLETDGLFDGASRKGVDEQAAAKEFEATLRAVAKRDVSVDVAAVKRYRGAFARYMRSGENSLSMEEQASLQVGSAPDGGYFVLPDMGGKIATKIFETSPMRQICDVQSIGTDALEGVIDNNEASSGWTGETTAITETNTPQVGKYRIPVHIQYAEPRATQQLLDDAMIDMEAWLAAKVADKLIRTENAAFITGNGVGKPNGILSAARTAPVTTADATRTWGTLQYIATGTSAAFGATTPADEILDTIYALKAGYRQGASFLMARLTVAEARKLKDGQGNYLWAAGDKTAGQPSTLFGYPIVEAEDMPAIAANSLSVLFGNFKVAYQIVDRAGITVLRDPFTAKPYVKFYTTKRVGGDLVNSEALKVMKFAAS